MRLWVPALVLLAITSTAAADLDDDDAQWALSVKPLLLDEEMKILESLKTKADRLEFRKIFWARRDPDLLTTGNEMQSQYEQRRPEADKRFYTSAYVPQARSTDALGAQPRRSQDPLATFATADMEETQLRMYRDQRERPAMEGGLTDCGVFYLVFGEPDAVEKRPHTVWGPREPQKWTYKDKGGFLFDEACMLPVGNDKIRQKVKQYAVVQPTIGYHVKSGELLKTLADMMPKVSPIAALLRAPREDFRFETETHFLKVEDRTGVFGLVRGEGESLFRESQSGGRARVLVRAEIAQDGATGSPVGSEREMLVDVSPDGTFLASYRIGTRPGKYTLTVGVLDANNGKASVLSTPIEVPDFGSGTLTVAPILALLGVDEGGKKDPRHPMEAFRLGQMLLLPRFGNVFHPSDSLTVSYQFYDPAVDPVTQKANAVGKIRILRANGSPVAEGPDDNFDSEVGGTIVGPVSLAGYPPGRYKIQLKVMDNVAGKVVTRDTTFEVASHETAEAAP